jgi:hypothetical protein
MVLNATFNNVSVIAWQSVLLVKETGVSEEKGKFRDCEMDTDDQSYVNFTF